MLHLSQNAPRVFISVLFIYGNFSFCLNWPNLYCNYYHLRRVHTILRQLNVPFRPVTYRYLSLPIVPSSICEHPESRETERIETKHRLTVEYWILFQLQLPFNGQYLTNQIAVNFTRLKFARSRDSDISGSGSYREIQCHSVQLPTISRSSPKDDEKLASPVDYGLLPPLPPLTKIRRSFALLFSASCAIIEQ